MVGKTVLPKPTRTGIVRIAERFILHDENGEFLTFEEAERMVDQIFETYAGVSCRYIKQPTGREELVITSITGRAEYLRIRINRNL